MTLRENTAVYFFTAAVNHVDHISRGILGYAARAGLVGGAAVGATRLLGNYTHPLVRHPAVQVGAAVVSVAAVESTLLVLGDNPTVKAQRVANGVGRLKSRLNSDMPGWSLSDQEAAWVDNAFANAGVPVEATGPELHSVATGT